MPAIVPFLVAERSYGYLAAAGITVAATVLSSVVQPLFGVLTDRRAMPWLVPFGMTVAGAGIGLSGLGDSYLFTWLAIALSGLGVAAYHPEAARLARRVARDGHVGMSWFALGGNAGFALGPVLVTPVLHFGGLGASPLLAIPALVGGLLTVAALRGVSGADAGVVERAGKDDWGQFGRLTVVVIARSMVTFGLATFLAIWVAQRTGGGTLAGGIALVVLFGVGAAGTLLGGVLANRWGRIRTVRVSYAVAIPAVAGVALVPGPAVYLMVAIAAVATYVPFPCTPRSARTICRTGSARPAASRSASPSVPADWPLPWSARSRPRRVFSGPCCRWRCCRSSPSWRRAAWSSRASGSGGRR